MSTSEGALPPARRMSWLERWLRVLVYCVCFAAVFAYAEVAGSLWAIRFTRPRSPTRVRRSNTVYRHWGCALYWLTIRILGARLDLRGEVPPGRHVVISNHQSTADIAVLMANLRPFNCKFVAKRMLRHFIPAISVALAHGGGALITRGRSKRDVEELRRMGRDLAHWEGSAIIFAEGTRSRDGAVLPYRAAAARLVAAEAGLPLLPVAVDGTWAAADLPGFTRNMPGLRVALRIGTPIPPESWEGRLDETLEEIRLWTINTLDELRRAGRVEPPPGWSPTATPSPTRTASSPP